MAPSKGIPLLDAATLLVGWSNRSASRGHDKVFVSGEVVQLSTKLDASNRFSLIAAIPGHSQAVTVLLEVAPQLRDGRMGTFVGVASVAIPAKGGRVEAHINGQDIQLDPADVANADPPALCFARAVVSPSTPDGMTVGPPQPRVSGPAPTPITGPAADWSPAVPAQAIGPASSRAFADLKAALQRQLST